MCDGYKCLLGTGVCPIQVCTYRIQVGVGYKWVSDTSVYRIQVFLDTSVCQILTCVCWGLKVLGYKCFICKFEYKYADESSFAPSID